MFNWSKHLVSVYIRNNLISSMWFYRVVTIKNNNKYKSLGDTMKKLLISTSVASALALVGCGGETMSDLQAETLQQQPLSRVVFDPGAGNLNIPNDLLMLPGDDGFFDYTLNIPVADATDFTDPQNALNVLDGWSVSQPFVINVETPSGVSLDASTISAGVSLYEATLGLNQSDPDCAAIPIPSAGCKVGDKLTFGVDYVVSLADNDTIAFVPLKPLKPSQGYILVLTDALKDSTGRSVQGSTTWGLVNQDPATSPLGSEAQLGLQTLINSIVVSLSQVGLARENITYAASFTTQSTTVVLETIKKVMVGEFAARAAAGDPTAGMALPAMTVVDAPDAPNAMEALGLVSAEAVAGAVQFGISQLPSEAAALVPAIQAADFSAMTTCSGLLTAAAGGFGNPITQVNDFAAGVAGGVLAAAGPFCAAKHVRATISLPHFLAIPRADNPLAPVTEFMTAACDSGIVLAGFAGLPAAVQATYSAGPNDATCTAVGLRDLQDANGDPLDRDRNVTRFSPIPQAKGGNAGNMTLDVQITVPDPMVIAALGQPGMTMPDAGWPVAILYHGITRQKEDMLAITAALSFAGVATVAIDHPLHGSRGYDLDGDGTDEINATTVSATHYMNLQTLPTAKANLTQSVSDLLGLRLGLNAVIDTSTGSVAMLDASNVSVMGVSLGGIAGGNFAAVANTSMGGDLSALDGMFSVAAASLESPGAGTAQFLLESPSFGPLIKSLLLSQASPEFAALVAGTYPAGATEAQTSGLVQPFLDALSDAQLASVNATFNQFAFAAQTSLDGADPISFVNALGMNTPTHVMTVVGDGGTNLPDQVIPVSTASPLAGQDAYVEQAGLMQVSASAESTEPMSGYVLFNEGAHGSSLSPESSAAVTLEMQTQVAAFIASGGRVLPITNTTVVE
jgi:Pla-1/cef family extracellular lipase